MKAVTLAAGRGSRLGELSQASPKTLMTLAGKPLLVWQLAALRSAGITETAIVCGYCAEQLQYYADRSVYNAEWRQTNIVGSLLCADPLLAADTHIVSYGDIVYRPDIVRALQACSADIAITSDQCWLPLWQQRFIDPLSDAECFEQAHGWLQKIGGRATTLTQIQGQYMGLLKITPQGWQHITAVLSVLAPGAAKQLDMTSMLNLLLSHDVRVAVVPVQGGWVEVDTPTDLLLYERLVQTDNWSHDWRR